MKIAVLGTGMVGQTLAAGLAERGHEVRIGTREVSLALGRGAPGEFGAWAAQHPDLPVLSFADAAADADLVIDALAGAGAVAGVGQARIADGTILLDIANPLVTEDGSTSLFVGNTDSLAEQVQRAYPSLRVVKALNTMTAALMVAPQLLAGGEFSSFVCGDDTEAKAVVTGLLTELGHRDVIDLGGLAAARGTEALMLIWLRLWGALGTPMFTYKIVR